MKKINESTKMIIVLVIVSLISAVSLSMVYEKTKPIIEENKAKELKMSLNEVIPQAYRFEEDNTMDEIISEGREGIKKVFNAYDKDDKKIGVAFLLDSIGFGGTIKILVGMNLPFRKITGTKILDHLETPGLGERITEPEFLNQFKDASAKMTTYQMDAVSGATVPAELVMKDEMIDAITGATISSTAVIETISWNINIISSYITEHGDVSENSPTIQLNISNTENAST